MISLPKSARKSNSVKSQVSLDQLRGQIVDKPRCRNFYKAVTKRHPRGLNVIAEVKKASPSAGLIREDFDPVAIATTYERCGADAISVLTDEKYFQGRLEYLEQVKEAVSVPVLRKDFIIDAWQVYESRAAGADAILLIAEALKPGDLIDLMIAAAELGLTVLLEVHEADTLLAVRSLIGFPEEGLQRPGHQQPRPDDDERGHPHDGPPVHAPGRGWRAGLRERHQDPCRCPEAESRSASGPSSSARPSASTRTSRRSSESCSTEEHYALGKEHLACR